MMKKIWLRIKISCNQWEGLAYTCGVVWDLGFFFSSFELVRAWSRLRVVVSSYKMQQQGHEVQAGPRKRPAYRVAGQAWWRSGACEAPRRSPHPSCRPSFPLPLTPALCVRTSPIPRLFRHSSRSHPSLAPPLPPSLRRTQLSNSDLQAVIYSLVTSRLSSPQSSGVVDSTTDFSVSPAAITSLSDNAVFPKPHHILFHPACVRNHIVDRSWAPGYGYVLSTYI